MGAGRGDKRCWYYVGVLYLHGEGIIQDFGQALECLLRAVRGQSGAQYTVRNMYRLFRGQGQDLFVAMGWYEKAAAKGHAEARSYFGRHRRIGRRK